LGAHVADIETFIDSAVWHGGLERANAMLAADPTLAGRSIFTAAILGDDAAVRRFVAVDPAAATAVSGPYGATALVYLCFSNYLRLEPARTPAFVSAATALLDAGADPNGGFRSTGDYPEWETAIYGAAGVAHNAALTQLLLDRGVDPNDNETPYHAPETYDNSALKVLVESGKLTAESLSMILLRKTDWHDYDAIKWLLARGIAPDAMTRWGKTALHNAMLSDNDLAIVDLLLDRGADPTRIAEQPERGSPRPGHRSAVEMAARRGRGDALEAFERRGFNVRLDGVERLLAACARHQAEKAHEIAAAEPGARAELVTDGGRFLAGFAGVGNTEGVRLLLDLGVPLNARFAEGEGYFDVAPDSLAIHVAAWRAQHATLRLLIERGSPIDALDGKGRSPLMLAVRACVDSYWSGRRTPESVQALLAAGASIEGVAFPSGYAAVDELLRRRAAG
jgi:ankyrin repeat protein